MEPVEGLELDVGNAISGVIDTSRDFACAKTGAHNDKPDVLEACSVLRSSARSASTTMATGDAIIRVRHAWLATPWSAVHDADRQVLDALFVRSHFTLLLLATVKGNTQKYPRVAWRCSPDVVRARRRIAFLTKYCDLTTGGNTMAGRQKDSRPVIQDGRLAATFGILRRRDGRIRAI